MGDTVGEQREWNMGEAVNLMWEVNDTEVLGG